MINESFFRLFSTGLVNMTILSLFEGLINFRKQKVKIFETPLFDLYGSALKPIYYNKQLSSISISQKMHDSHLGFSQLDLTTLLLKCSAL